VKIPDSKTDIIIDFDGTIVTLKINCIKWHHGVGELFRKFDHSFDLHLSNKRVDFFQNNYFTKYGRTLQSEVSLFNEKYEEENVKGFDVHPKILELIQTSKSNLYIWSSNSGKTINKILERLQIKNRFRNIVSREKTFLLKPNPEGFNLIFDGTKKDKYVFIGDSSFDKEAAEQVKIDYIDVTVLE